MNKNSHNISTNFIRLPRKIKEKEKRDKERENKG